MADTATPFSTDRYGVIRIAGTRVTLDTVVAAYRRGDTHEQIAEDYSSLELTDVHGAIFYYLTHREEVESYLDRRRRQSQAVREEFRARFPADGLKERLRRRLGDL